MENPVSLEAFLQESNIKNLMNSSKQKNQGKGLTVPVVGAYLVTMLFGLTLIQSRIHANNHLEFAKRKNFSEAKWFPTIIKMISNNNKNVFKGKSGQCLASGKVLLSRLVLLVEMEVGLMLKKVTWAKWNVLD